MLGDGKEISEAEFFAKYPEVAKAFSSNTTRYYNSEGKEISKAEFFRPIIIRGPDRYFDSSGREVSGLNEISPMESGPGHIGNSLIGRIN